MASPVYYNENDAYAAQWLRNLIEAGHIPGGYVDERDIREVQPADLDGFVQCHFFAGVAGWSHALELAGWECPVWTGSCPCQPLSSAGQRKGHADERHLWPAFHALIAECRPRTIFGEQVASKDGREWLAGIRADLADLGYAVGAADLPAAGVGAPHIRQRLFWVADAHGEEPCDEELQRGGEHGFEPTDSGIGGVADHIGERHPSLQRCGFGYIYQNREVCGARARSECRRSTSGVEHANHARPQGYRHSGKRPSQCPAGTTSSTGHWSNFDIIPCSDGKARRIEPGSFPLAHGVPNRVGRLRAYGNAIVPQAAAEFIAAFMEVKG